MKTQTTERFLSTEALKNNWTLAIAALAALVVGAAGLLAVSGGLGQAPRAASASPLELETAPQDTLSSCLAFSPEELAKVGEIAFSGTVTSVSGAEVTLSVDEWFKGGDATEVVLNAPLGMEALIGGIPFIEGQQYLMTARSGTVNYCGFSGLVTPEFGTAFQRAFGN